MNGAESIAAERKRQVTEKGFTADHDRHHPIRHFVLQAGHLLDLRAVSVPWCERRGRGIYHRDDLVRAGAIIAAAIDRIDEIDGRTDR